MTPVTQDDNKLASSPLAAYLDIMQCPSCAGRLEIAGAVPGLRCAACHHLFPSDGQVPLLFWPTAWKTEHQDVTELVRAFYEETPFPNYDDIDSPETLRVKAEQGVFARLLNEQIPHGARILEAGCGTGQLSNYLALRWGRTVFGTDLCLNSLRLAQAFKERHGLSGVVFLQQNLFRLVFNPDVFDVVISNGVLHHTGNPFLGFQTILRSLRPGGHVIIGLYNRYGRLTTDFRRIVFRLTRGRLTSLDPRLRLRTLNAARRRAWFRDQYQHPHESKHTIDEVLSWFDRSGVEFVNAIPKCVAGTSFSSGERLFDVNPRGTSLDHALVQLGMLLSGGREGGFFMMIGRKR